MSSRNSIGLMGVKIEISNFKSGEFEEIVEDEFRLILPTSAASSSAQIER